MLKTIIVETCKAIKADFVYSRERRKFMKLIKQKDKECNKYISDIRKANPGMSLANLYNMIWTGRL